MKKILLSYFLALGISTSAQSVIFEDSFEGYTDFAIANVGNWTLTDVDLKTTYGFQQVQFPNTGVAKSFQVFNATTTAPPLTPTTTSNWTARTGNKSMVAFASTSAPWNNDWLISPKIQLISGGAELSFWAKSCDTSYGAEKFRVYISTTGTAVSNFTPITAELTTPSDATWYKYTYDLSAYSGKEIHVAIQCTSKDQFGFAVDDFKVMSTIPATSAPNCATLTAPTNGNTSVAVNPSVTLSWEAATTGDAASSYDVYLGTSPNPTTLLGNYTTTSTSVTALAPLTTYYWKVVPKNNIGASTNCSEFSFKTANSNPPGCVTIVTPTAGATGIKAGTTPLSWQAPTTGGTPTTYDVYWGTTSGSLTKLGSTANTAVSIINTSYNTTYYWKIVAINADGNTNGCPEYSFTTEANPFAPYCGPLKFEIDFFGMTLDGTEAISLVNFAGINNATDPLAEDEHHEIFLNQVANVDKGSTYEIKLEGNTGGDYADNFVVFIDWNQNGKLDDAGEVYEVPTQLINSTGSDGKQVTLNIKVPNDAKSGITRMRVKKIADDEGEDMANLLDPCAGAAYGQAEDYTVNVSNLAVNDINKVKVQAYPNPVTDLLKINTSSNAKTISVFDISGKNILTQTANSSNNEVNMSKVTPGTYVVVIETETGKESIKVIKK